MRILKTLDAYWDEVYYTSLCDASLPHFRWISVIITTFLGALNVLQTQTLLSVVEDLGNDFPIKQALWALKYAKSE